MQDVFDAIQHTGPTDIRLRSSVTEERADGSKSLDPSWTTSDSGTHLAEVDGGWIYRKGMIGLDALQIVALEEGIITDERAYPNGEQFWDAVEALRDRGAHIPEYDPDDDSAPASVGEAENQSSVAGSSTGDSVGTPLAGNAAGTAGGVDRAAEQSLRDHELELLRERVSEQRTTIEELEATVAELRTQLERRETELAALRREVATEGENADADPEEPDRRPASRPWTWVRRWVGDQ